MCYTQFLWELLYDLLVAADCALVFDQPHQPTTHYRSDAVSSVWNGLSGDISDESDSKRRQKTVENSILPPARAVGNAFGRVCLCTCPVCALTFETLDIKTSFWCEISRSRSYIKVIKSRSKSQEQKQDRRG